jgi:hypothetical protein
MIGMMPMIPKNSGKIESGFLLSPFKMSILDFISA